MDEYSPKRHDIAILRFLCETLYEEGMAILNSSEQHWVNDPTALLNLQLNDHIEHVAFFVVTLNIKYLDQLFFLTQVNNYLDETFTLFSGYSISKVDLNEWKHLSIQLTDMLHSASVCTLE